MFINSPFFFLLIGSFLSLLEKLTATYFKKVRNSYLFLVANRNKDFIVFVREGKIF